MYAAGGRPACDRSEMLSVVGLSLPSRSQRSSPTSKQPNSRTGRRPTAGSLRLDPGGRPRLAALSRCKRSAREFAATPHISARNRQGKSRRGLRHVFAAHDVGHFFTTTQTPPTETPLEASPLDDRGGARGRPAPSLIEPLSWGDTVFDIEMGRAAGVATIGVAWGLSCSGAPRRGGGGCRHHGVRRPRGAIREVSEVSDERLGAPEILDRGPRQAGGGRSRDPSRRPADPDCPHRAPLVSPTRARSRRRWPTSGGHRANGLSCPRRCRLPGR